MSARGARDMRRVRDVRYMATQRAAAPAARDCVHCLRLGVRLGLCLGDCCGDGVRDRLDMRDRVVLGNRVLMDLGHGSRLCRATGGQRCGNRCGHRDQERLRSAPAVARQVERIHGAEPRSDSEAIAADRAMITPGLPSRVARTAESLKVSGVVGPTEADRMHVIDRHPIALRTFDIGSYRAQRRSNGWTGRSGPGDQTQPASDAHDFVRWLSQLPRSPFRPGEQKGPPSRPRRGP